MSRIGRMPLVIPAGVEITVSPENVVTVKGPKGTLQRAVDKHISVNIDGGVLHCTRSNEEKEVKSMHGLYRKLIGNMVEGVTKGVRRHQTVDDAFIQALYADASALYHLDQTSAAAGKADLGPLPATAVALLAALGVAWAGIALWALLQALRRRARQGGASPGTPVQNG